jgi:multiple sugar transport system ATP-binding protein
MPKNLFVAEFIGAPKMNTFRTRLSYENGTHYVSPFGAKIAVDGRKAEMLKERNIGGGDIVLGVRPEHIKLTNKNNPSAIPCKIEVNEMMGSELHLHVVTASGDKLIVRVPAVTLDDNVRGALVYGATIYVTFEGKVMHFFDPKTEKNLLV